MTTLSSPAAPSAYRQSRAKLWIRTGILAVFGTLFGWTLYGDIRSGILPLAWGLAIFLLLLPVGFWMRKLVPMQIHPHWKVITLSFDRVYFGLILFLVALKLVASKLPGLTVIADGAMCTILGLMIGRLSGICLRVHGLRKQFQ